MTSNLPFVNFRVDFPNFCNWRSIGHVFGNTLYDTLFCRAVQNKIVAVLMYVQTYRQVL